MAVLAVAAHFPRPPPPPPPPPRRPQIADPRRRSILPRGLPARALPALCVLSLSFSLQLPLGVVDSAFACLKSRERGCLIVQRGGPAAPERRAQQQQQRPQRRRNFDQGEERSGEERRGGKLVEMARKKIREYSSKRLLKEHLKRLAKIDVDIKCAQITEETDFNELADIEPWLNSTRLVVKPDMLFGKRGKSGLVALNLDLAGVEGFIKERLGKEVEMGGCKGPITTFIVEPFMPHEEEYYISIVSDRLGTDVSFSECGGVEIEENWDKVKTVHVPTGQTLNAELSAPLIATLPLEIRKNMESFIKGVFDVYTDLDFTLLEMNPFTLVNGSPYPLDMRGELDDTALFKNFKKWGDVEFPLPFGRTMSPAEEKIHRLDEKTGASLKLTILNPKGRIWTMVAGGGASVIYADTVGDLGYAGELGNYAEYSGAPNEEETLQYARSLIDVATTNPDGRPRALLVGGGIANFTDVAATFSGIIRAFKEKQAQLKAAKIRIYVRRGGPNYLRGLAKMRELGDEIGVPTEVYGPEATMTGICKQAIEYVKGGPVA